LLIVGLAVVLGGCSAQADSESGPRSQFGGTAPGESAASDVGAAAARPPGTASAADRYSEAGQWSGTSSLRSQFGGTVPGIAPE